ncbi:DUF2784 domain-containing protein [Symmachiella dynata]|uniref:DUF2784 domain-containing protein n=1 Tax=Symmachiella dynata TaxID=2527995 RepID=UPI0030EF4085|tara:strand:- start:515 stop:976 length:462 start_codon:yes stop_codon:yes gene_type:complete
MRLQRIVVCMQTLYSLLADAVVFLHGAYVAFVIFGLLAVLVGSLLGKRWVSNFWFRSLHLTMILIVVVESWLGIVCPLTTLEKFLRQKAGADEYPGDFIGRWVHDVLFMDLSPATFTVMYTLFGLSVVATLIIVPPRWPWRKSDSRTADDISG